MKHKQDLKVWDDDKINNLNRLFYFIISDAKSPWPISQQKHDFPWEHLK